MMTDERIESILSYKKTFATDEKVLLCEMVVDLRSKLSCDKSEIEYLNDEVERLRHELSIVILNRNSLRQEADELKRRLAVFTDGKPRSATLFTAARCYGDPIVSEWLLRISSHTEVPHD